MYKLFASPSDIVSLEFHNLACCTECLKKLEDKVKELRSETKKL